MTKLRQLESLLRQYPKSYLTDTELNVLFKGSSDSRYGKVKRMVAQGKLLRVRRGLFCLTEELGCTEKPHPYELAQYIYGPSYISLESAFSFHHLIPERVYTVTSMTCKRSKIFHTVLGDFQFYHLSASSLYAGVELIKDGTCAFLMAKPWKAMCDYLVCYKKNWDSLEPFVENLCFDLNNLPLLREEEREVLIDFYRSIRVEKFLNQVKHGAL